MLCRPVLPIADIAAVAVTVISAPYHLWIACLAVGFRFLYRYCSLVRALSPLVCRGSLRLGTSSPFHWAVGAASLEVDVGVSCRGETVNPVLCRAVFGVWHYSEFDAAGLRAAIAPVGFGLRGRIWRPTISRHFRPALLLSYRLRGMNDYAPFLFRRKVNHPLRRDKAKVHLPENLPPSARVFSCRALS